MFQFRRPPANGELDPLAAEVLHEQHTPAPPGEGSFADKMLRSTLGIGMADMQRLGQEAQAMVAQFDARMAAIESTTRAIEAKLDRIEQHLSGLGARLGK